MDDYFNDYRRQYDRDWTLFDSEEDRWRDEPTEPSFEWDLENFAAASSEFTNSPTFVPQDICDNYYEAGVIIGQF